MRRISIFFIQGAIIFALTTLLQQLSAHGLAFASWNVTGDQFFISAFGAFFLGLIAQSDWGQRTFRKRPL